MQAAAEAERGGSATAEKQQASTARRIVVAVDASEVRRRPAARAAYELAANPSPCSSDCLASLLQDSIDAFTWVRAAQCTCQ